MKHFLPVYLFRSRIHILWMVVFFGITPVWADSDEHVVGIRHRVVIESDVVKLQDIFTNIEKNRYKDRIVIESPPPGEVTVLPAHWLARLAESYLISWKPLTNFDEVEVVRTSRRVEEEELKQIITSNINQKMDGKYNYLVELDNGLTAYHLPSNMTGDIRLNQLSYKPQSGRFTGLIVTSDKYGRSLPIRGFAHRVIDMPVLSQSFSKGSIIKEEHITYKQVRWNHVPRDAITSVDELKGMAARTRVQGNSILRQSQIEKPVLVRNKNLILVELSTGRMTVRLRAQAMEDGHMGELIRVRNLKSKKIFEAEIVGLKKARVIVEDSDVAYLP